jgi:hypothetical protein
LDAASDLPYTISFAVLYRAKIDSFGNLPKDKQPPRDLWDKPYRLGKFLDTVWGDKKKSSDNMIEFDEEEIE